MLTTLNSIFSKILSIMLEKRPIRDFVEINNVMTEYQFGFRSGKGANDCIFFIKFHYSDSSKC